MEVGEFEKKPSTYYNHQKGRLIMEYLIKSGLKLSILLLFVTQEFYNADYASGAVVNMQNQLLVWSDGSSVNPERLLNEPSDQTNNLFIVIGQDVSSSFAGYDLMKIAHIRQICQIAESTGRESVICFELIGLPNDRSFLRLHLTALPQVDDPKYTMSERANLIKKKRVLKVKNQKEVEFFLTQCAVLLKTYQRETATDLNGFLRKSGTLLAEPAYRAYTKLLFLHTDGKHALPKTSSEIQWKLPKSTHLCISGWKQFNLNAKADLFESPQGFIDYLEKIL